MMETSEDDAKGKAARVSRVQLVLLIACLALGLTARLHKLTAQGYDKDELISISVANGHGLAYQDVPEAQWVKPAPDWMRLEHAEGIGHVATRLARDDNHPPLYFMMLRGWMKWFGTSRGATRPLSVLISMVGLLLIFDVGRIMHRTNVGLWACAIMALAEPQVFYAQETRNYALMTTGLLMACSALVRIEKLGPSRWRVGGLALGCWVTAMSHYFAFPVLAAMGIYTLLRLRGEKLRAALFGFFIAGAVFLVVWGPGFWRQRQNVEPNNHWLMDLTEHPKLWTLWRFALAPAMLLNEPLNNMERVAIVGAVLYILPLILWRKRPELLLWGMMLISTPLVLAALDMARNAKQLEAVRYTLGAAPPMYLLLAAILPERVGKLWMSLPAAAVLSCMLSLERAYYDVAYKIDWQPFLSVLDANRGERDAMIVMEDVGWGRTKYLGLTQTGDLPDALMFVETTAPKPEVATACLDYSGVWVVTSPMEGLPDFLPAGAKVVAVVHDPLAFRLFKVKWEN
jgi:hypothetical protein